MTRMTISVAVLAATVVALAALAVAAAPPGPLFVTSDQCMACHNGLVTPSGDDISIGSDWRASMMAHSARDPYWQASVRRETLVHPTASAAIQHECSACHMPMMRFEAKAAGGQGEVFAHLPIPQQTTMGRLAADGVSCTMCHQIRAEGLGSEESFTAGFEVDTATPLGEREAFGPFEVTDGRKSLMRSASLFVPAKADHVSGSELCATCHTLYTHTLDDDGEVVGELPEQVPYLEWLHSDYPDERSCQSCHMPVVEEEAVAASVLGETRSGVSRHVFRGGNFFMPRMLNLLRAELGVVAEPLELETTSRRTLEHLETSAATLEVARAEVVGSDLEAEIVVRNLAGHKLPTAYPSRRAWIRFTVRDERGEIVFSSGAVGRDGAIEGNDNDTDPLRYEPHYAEITSAEQVQIYEGILAEPDGEVTTVLLSAIRYVKDNRLLPAGFDPATADPDIAVQGVAADDADFLGGGDRVRYRVPVDGAGPYQVHAELWYQPIAFRWARNVGDRPSAEGERFLAAYDRLAATSAAVLARASTTAAGRR